MPSTGDDGEDVNLDIVFGFLVVHMKILRMPKGRERLYFLSSQPGLKQSLTMTGKIRIRTEKRKML